VKGKNREKRWKILLFIYIVSVFLNKNDVTNKMGNADACDAGETAVRG